MEHNQKDKLAGKEEVEKITLRVLPATAERLRQVADKLQLPQGNAFDKMVSERDKARRSARKYRRKLKALERAGFVHPRANSNANVETFVTQSVPGSSTDLMPISAEIISANGDRTDALQRIPGEQKAAKESLLDSLRDNTIAAIKAAQSFSQISVDAKDAIKDIAEVKRISQSSFESQKTQITNQIDAIGGKLKEKIDEERKSYDELILKKEDGVNTLLEKAKSLAKAYSDSFNDGVKQLDPEVKEIKKTIQDEVATVARFNRWSIGAAGAVFLVGLATIYFFKPVAEMWHTDTQVSAAVTAVTTEYAKKIAAAESKALELQSTLDRMKKDEEKVKKQAQAEAEIAVRKDIEKMKLQSFAMAVQKVQRELTDANKHIGDLQARNLDLRRKLAKNCSWFCSGDYDASNPEMQ